MKRSEGRTAKSLRPVKITRNYLKDPEGSVLIAMGNTKVICTASVSESVPFHKRNTGSGWVTAEYSMLPRATTQRSNRERGKVKGRTQEIQRLIGRSLRAVVDLEALGERSITVDCDVIQADGGTRCASITGAFVALYDAMAKLRQDKKIEHPAIKDFIAAISVGIVGEDHLVDLDYSEDFQAEVDMNVVMTGSGNIVEIQGTAEGHPFSKQDLDQLLNKASLAIKELIAIQKKILKVK